MSANGEKNCSMPFFLRKLYNCKPLVIAVGLTTILAFYLSFFIDFPSSPVVWTISNKFSLPNGIEAPDFVLPTFQGETVRLSSFRKQRVALAFVRAGCTYCTKLHKMLESFTLSGGKHLFIICKDAEDVKNIKDMYSFNFPVLIDSAGIIHRTYKVKGFPRIYIINNLGKIEDGITGWPSAWKIIQEKL